MRKIQIFFILSFFTLQIYSQELNCNVSIVHNQIQGTNKQIFQTLQNAIREFVNNTVWTNNVFAINERIECNLLINLQEQVGADGFRGTLQVQARRPVYNSSYNSVLFNYMDNDLSFSYVEFQPLEFSETSHISNLTSILAYYAYIILGFDYDSFSPEGGTPFFEQAERIVNNAQNAPETGWRPGDNVKRKNRYWLVENILNVDYSPVREFYYKYHRLGLDMMDENANVARAAIAEDLKLLQTVKREKPDPYMHFLQVALDAKSDEFVNVFSETTQDEKTRVYAMLNEIDPSNKQKYEKIKENQ
ncbi:MAG: DUF4835 family protein [Bacteroidales bacterium]|nr:DUF4835 family protein [Bacteroidales bacterium]